MSHIVCQLLHLVHFCCVSFILLYIIHFCCVAADGGVVRWMNEGWNTPICREARMARCRPTSSVIPASTHGVFHMLLLLLKIDVKFRKLA